MNLGIAVGVAITLLNVTVFVLRRPTPLKPFLDVGVQLSTPASQTTNRANRTAVLLLDVLCYHCKLNLPVYREVARAVTETPGTRFVILTDGPADEARTWLDQGGITGGEVVAIKSRKSLGFVGTPTLLLTDASDVVTDIRIGELNREEMDRFTGRLRGESGYPPLTLPYQLKEVSAREHPEIEAQSGSQLIDVRKPEDFARSHSPLARNIPEKELLSSRSAEVSSSLPVYVDCRYYDQGECRVTASSLGSKGFSKVIILLR